MLYALNVLVDAFQDHFELLLDVRLLNSLILPHAHQAHQDVLHWHRPSVVAAEQASQPIEENRQLSGVSLLSSRFPL